MGCRLFICTQRSAPLAACETTCGVQAGVIRVQGPPSDSSTVLCRHVSDHATSFTRRHLRSAAHWDLVELQNNKIRNAKFSRICSINLELNTDDRSRQFQWTFESWTVSQSLQNWQLILYCYYVTDYLSLLWRQIHQVILLVWEPWCRAYTGGSSVEGLHFQSNSKLITCTVHLKILN